MEEYLVRVEFSKNAKQLYTYRVAELEVKKDDWVVVMAGQYKVVKVIEVIYDYTPEQDEIATKYVVDTVDVTAHKVRVKNEKDRV